VQREDSMQALAIDVSAELASSDQRFASSAGEGQLLLDHYCVAGSHVIGPLIAAAERFADAIGGSPFAEPAHGAELLTELLDLSPEDVDMALAAAYAFASGRTQQPAKAWAFDFAASMPGFGLHASDDRPGALIAFLMCDPEAANVVVHDLIAAGSVVGRGGFRADDFILRLDHEAEAPEFTLTYFAWQPSVPLNWEAGHAAIDRLSAVQRDVRCLVGNDASAVDALRRQLHQDLDRFRSMFGRADLPLPAGDLVDFAHRVAPDLGWLTERRLDLRRAIGDGGYVVAVSPLVTQSRPGWQAMFALVPETDDDEAILAGDDVVNLVGRTLLGEVGIWDAVGVSAVILSATPSRDGTAFYVLKPAVNRHLRVLSPRPG
jgi:hypothetical protein